MYFKPNYIFKMRKSNISMHPFSDKTRQNKPITILISIDQTNNLIGEWAYSSQSQTGPLIYTLGFKRSMIASKFAFLWIKNKDLKVSSPEESSCIVAHENVNFSTGNYKTKGSKFADETAECWALFERSYSYLWRAARSFELTSKIKKLNCSHWFYSKYSPDRISEHTLLTDH